jgi:hypothetical protein
VAAEPHVLDRDHRVSQCRRDAGERQSAAEASVVEPGQHVPAAVDHRGPTGGRTSLGRSGRTSTIGPHVVVRSPSSTTTPANRRDGVVVAGPGMP